MIQTVLETSVVREESKVPIVVNHVETVDEIIPVAAVEEQEDETIYTINDLLLERKKTIPESPLLGYPASTRGSGDYVYYTATDLDRFTDGAVKVLCDQGLPPNVRST